MLPSQNEIKSHPVFEDWAVLYKLNFVMESTDMFTPFVKNVRPFRKHNKIKSWITFKIAGYEIWLYPISIINTSFNGIYEGLECVIKFFEKWS